LNSYADAQSTNNPARNYLRWTREVNNINASDDPESRGVYLQPGETKTLHSGLYTLGQDGTTHYSLSTTPGVASNYTLLSTSGTSPAFRTIRPLTSLDNTSSVTIAQNAEVSVLMVSAGPSQSFSGIQAGDQIRLGPAFNTLNQGVFTVVAAGPTSVTYLNITGLSETVALGTTLSANLRAYSAAGVQLGDSLVIAGGFLSPSWGTYEITDVTDNSIAFSCAANLPIESNIQTNQIFAYTAAKSLIYVESNKKVSLAINASGQANIEPFVDSAGAVTPGILLNKATIYSLTITNTDVDTATVYFASVE
jgi:hypothetical protein